MENPYKDVELRKHPYAVEMPELLRKNLCGRFHERMTKERLKEAVPHLPELYEALEEHTGNVLKAMEKLPDHPRRKQRVTPEIMRSLFDEWYGLERSWLGVERVAGNFFRVYNLHDPREERTGFKWLRESRKEPEFKKWDALGKWLNRRNADGSVIPDKRSTRARAASSSPTTRPHGTA